MQFLQNTDKEYRIEPITAVWRRHILKKEGRDGMNFYDKKFRKVVSMVILVIIAAMVATMVIPYLL